VERLLEMQQGRPRPWSIVQKQTGADRMSLGGALGANIHGRGLRFAPFIQDVEAFTLLDAGGELRVCSRRDEPELFRAAIGGYGLFGVVTSVGLRLRPRTKLERVVEIVDVDDLMPALQQRIAAGYLYGDCQFSTDMGSEGFMETGVFSCYRPLPDDTPMPAAHKELTERDWRRLYFLAHADTKSTYETYSSYYLSTHGQRYWSDLHQMSAYVDEYHGEVDRQIGAKTSGSEMITELYVPREALPAFLRAVRDDFRRHAVRLIYGTIRLIERDPESFLAWAREPYACTVMNLHVDHSDAGIAKAEADFRRLIDRAIEYGGSYYLTYHRWASRRQVETCYPQMPEFLRLKRKHDPQELFQNDWYRHYKAMFADQI
jgi:FAD/FMN-containing dehydrogenase